MKAKDLMIGDWVKEHNDCRGIIMDAKDLISGDLVKEHCIGDFVFRVSSITKHIVGSILDGDICASSIDKVEPIPITEKILLDNGFERPEILHYSYEEFVKVVDGVNVYMYKENEIWLFTMDNIPCVRTSAQTAHICIGMNYVHELQHILRFFNIDLEIEL